MKIQPQFKDAVIAVTYICNLRCQMCNIWKMTDHKYLPVNAYQKLPPGLREINISGGEPFLRPDIAELTATIAKTCPKARIIFSSNGYATELIIEQMKKILFCSKNIGIAISIDGIGDVHDKIRGIPGCYQKSLETIEKLKSLGLTERNLKIAFTLNDQNADELKKVYALSQTLGADFSISAVHNSDHYFSINTNQITRLDEIREVLAWLANQELKHKNFKKWLRAYFAYGLWQFIKSGKRILPDYSGCDSFFMDPAGKIYISDISSNLIGDLNNISNTMAAVADVPSWMVCTVRSAVKRHPYKVLKWILINKLRGHAFFN